MNILAGCFPNGIYISELWEYTIYEYNLHTFTFTYVCMCIITERRFVRVYECVPYTQTHKQREVSYVIGADYIF